MASSSAAPDEGASDVLALRQLLFSETTSSELPLFDCLMWMRAVKNEKIAAEELQVGELGDVLVYASLQQPGTRAGTDMLQDRVVFTYGGPNDIGLVAITSLMVSYIAPFKYIIASVTNPLSRDCPLKAFILACFILRGHTKDASMRMHSAVFVGLRKALSDIKQGTEENGKGKDMAKSAPLIQPSAQQKLVSGDSHPKAREGHRIEAVQAELLKFFPFDNLPYIHQLKWQPSNTTGSSEKLKIGTRHKRTVFAVLNIHAKSSWQQLRILEGDGTASKDEISKASMSAVKFLEPYSHLKLDDAKPAFAQMLRTFLKGCFILRGHANRQAVSLDLKSFVRKVREIQMSGYEVQSGDSESEESSLLRSPPPEMKGLDELAYSQKDRERPSTADLNTTTCKEPTLALDKSLSSLKAAVATHEPSSSHSQASRTNTIGTKGETIGRRWTSVNKPGPNANNMLSSIEPRPSAGAKVVSAQLGPAFDTTTPDLTIARKIAQQLPPNLAVINKERVSTERPFSPRSNFSTVQTRRLSDPWSTSPATSPSPDTVANQAIATDDVTVDPNAEAETVEASTSLHDAVPGQNTVLNDHCSPTPTTSEHRAWLQAFHTVTASGRVIAAEQRRIQTHDTNISSLQHQLTCVKAATAALETNVHKACADAIVGDTQRILSTPRCSTQDLAAYNDNCSRLLQQAVTTRQQEASAVLTAHLETAQDAETELRRLIDDERGSRGGAQTTLLEAGTAMDDAKKRKRVIEAQGGFALGFFAGRETERSRKRTRWG